MQECIEVLATPLKETKKTDGRVVARIPLLRQRFGHRDRLHAVLNTENIKDACGGLDCGDDRDRELKRELLARKHHFVVAIEKRVHEDDRSHIMPLIVSIKRGKEIGRRLAL